MANFFALFFPQLITASLQSAVLIVLVLAVQRICGTRLKAGWRSALWLLVLVRLSLPLTIASPLSVFNFINVTAAAKNWTHHPHPDFSSAPSSIPLASAVDHAKPAAPIPSSSTAGSSIRYALMVWSMGIFILGVLLLITHLRLRRKINSGASLTDEAILHPLNECKQLMGIRTRIMVIESNAVTTPTLLGSIRPHLLLPPGFTGRFSTDELRHIFLHELAHIKRRDILIGWLMTIAQILHWFNPLVWFAGYRMRVDRELACDALALSCTRDEENQRYGETIIKLLQSFGDSNWSPGMAQAVENKNQLKERITMIAKFKKTNRGVALAIALFAGLALTTLTDARTGTAPSTDNISGTWVYIGYPGALGAPAAVGGWFKSRTNDTWAAYHIDPNTGKHVAHHGGTYKLKDNVYTESVNYDDYNTGVLNHKTFSFRITVQDGVFTQLGVGNPYSEVWKRITAEPPKPRELDSKDFEGTWVGYDTSDKKQSPVTILIKGSTLEFHEADTNAMLKADFALYDTTPKQLIGTITQCTNSSWFQTGMRFCAIYNLKDGVWTLSGYQPGLPAVPTQFDAPGAREILFKRK